MKRFNILTTGMPIPLVISWISVLPVSQTLWKLLSNWVISAQSLSSFGNCPPLFFPHCFQEVFQVLSSPPAHFLLWMFTKAGHPDKNGIEVINMNLRQRVPESWWPKGLYWDTKGEIKPSDFFFFPFLGHWGKVRLIQKHDIRVNCEENDVWVWES